MNIQNRNRLIDTKNRLMTARGEGLWVAWLSEKDEGIKKHYFGSYKLVTDVKYSRRNIVTNVVITTPGARWVLEISEGSLCKVCDCPTTMLYT